FDRGPVDGTRLILAGSWSVYWYNGLLVGSEIARGLDIYELVPSGLITQNELDAAKTVKWDYLNAQEQRKIVWPARFAKPRAFLDPLAGAKKLWAQLRQRGLKSLASHLESDVPGAADQPKVHMLVDAVIELANVR